MSSLVRRFVFGSFSNNLVLTVLLSQTILMQSKAKFHLINFDEGLYAGGVSLKYDFCYLFFFFIGMYQQSSKSFVLGCPRFLATTFLVSK